MKNLAPALLVLAACTPGTGAMIVRKDATAHVEPARREQVLANATKFLQSQGWNLEAQDAGSVTTQTMDTGTKTCAGSLCNSRSTVKVTVSEAGEVVVVLHREFYSGPPNGPGWFTPGLDEDVFVIEREQQNLLRAILDYKAGN